jgi:hypothetical protein
VRPFFFLILRTGTVCDVHQTDTSACADSLTDPKEVTLAVATDYLSAVVLPLRQSHIATDSQSWCWAQILDFWPEIFFSKLLSCLFLGGGALSDERSGLLCVSHCHWSLQQSVIIYNYLRLHFKFTHVTHNENKYKIIYTIYTGLFQSRLCTADYVPVTSSLHYNDSLDTWTVVHMTVAKFEPLIFFTFAVPCTLFLFSENGSAERFTLIVFLRSTSESGFC